MIEEVENYNVDSHDLLGKNSVTVKKARSLEKEGLTIGLRISKENIEYLHMQRYRNILEPQENLIVDDVS